MLLTSIAVVVLVLIVLSTVLWLASRYRTCPSDHILVVYGKVKGGHSANCIHGGGTFVLPLIQGYQYLSLKPMTINIPLENALSKQNIRINVPSNVVVGISTDPKIMQNAAERLLGYERNSIEKLAQEIILGQMRLTVASLDIEEINQDREKFLSAIKANVESELSKVGLYLINVNITDITDESGYISSIGKKAAAEAVNKAKVDVAEQEKSGNIGESSALREKDIEVAKNLASAEKGKKQAEADQRVFVQAKEAEAVQGENEAQKHIVQSQADLEVKKAEAKRLGEVARLEAEAAVQEAQYIAEQKRLKAAEILQKEVEKEKIRLEAEAEAERIREIARGDADAIKMRKEAEAEGIRKVMEATMNGYKLLIDSCGGNPDAAANILMTEKVEEVAKLQAEAIKNIKIDKITVWDQGASNSGTTATADFISNLYKSVPPLKDVTKMAGVNLPNFLGTEVAEVVNGKNGNNVKRNKTQEEEEK